MDTDWYIGLGAFVVCTIAACWWLRRQQRRLDEKGACCAYCGYNVYGLPSSTCPDCGSDIEVVGVRRPSRWMLLYPGTRRRLILLGWTLWMAGAVIMARDPFAYYLQPVILTPMDSVAFGIGPYGPRYDMPCLEIMRLWQCECRRFEIDTLPSVETPLIGWGLAVHPEYRRFELASEMILECGPTRGPIQEVFLVNGRDAKYAIAGRLHEKLIKGNGPYPETALQSWLEERFRDAGDVLSVPQVRDVLKKTLAAPYRSGDVPSGNLIVMRSGWARFRDPDSRFEYAGIGLAAFAWITGGLVIRHRMMRTRSQLNG